MPRDRRGFYLDCRICQDAVYMRAGRYVALVKAQAAPTCRECRRICGPDERDPAAAVQTTTSRGGFVMTGRPGQSVRQMRVSVATVRDD